MRRPVGLKLNIIAARRLLLSGATMGWVEAWVRVARQQFTQG
jgi:hypothetical protein